MHDLVIETTEEVAEQNGILFRLVDPIADIFIDKTGKAAGLLRFESVTAGPETFFVINSFREED